MGFMADGLEDFQKSERGIHHRSVYWLGSGPYHVQFHRHPGCYSSLYRVLGYSFS